MKAIIKATGEKTEVFLYKIDEMMSQTEFIDTNGKIYKASELGFVEFKLSPAKLMVRYNKETYYKSEKWLNPIDSPSTGSIVCYDGMIDYSEGPDRCTFLELADCHQKIRLHKTHTDTTEEFLEKLKIVRAEVDSFIKYFESQN